MSDFSAGVAGTVIGGIIVYFLKQIIDGFIRDRTSVKKEQMLIAGDNNKLEKITIKTDGPFSFKNKPIYINNTGTIHNIEIAEGQRDMLEVIFKDNSNVIIVPKNYTGHEINLNATVSGTTTVSGTSDK